MAVLDLGLLYSLIALVASPGRGYNDKLCAVRELGDCPNLLECWGTLHDIFLNCNSYVSVLLADYAASKCRIPNSRMQLQILPFQGQPEHSLHLGFEEKIAYVLLYQTYSLNGFLKQR